jgi:predicted CopG family antitoxin
MGVNNMKYKKITVTIDVELWYVLNRKRKAGESFSDVLRRIIESKSGVEL